MKLRVSELELIGKNGDITRAFVHHNSIQAIFSDDVESKGKHTVLIVAKSDVVLMIPKTIDEVYEQLLHDGWATSDYN